VAIHDGVLSGSLSDDDGGGIGWHRPWQNGF
jgi:hypothetical protein